jgi:hypothetical protein
MSNVDANFERYWTQLRAANSAIREDQKGLCQRVWMASKTANAGEAFLGTALKTWNHCVPGGVSKP